MRLLALISLLLSFHAAAAQLPATALAEAASQQLLSERIGKAYAWRGLDGDNSEPRRQHASASQQFARQLAHLRAASQGDTELSENYSLLAQLWQDYQALTNAPSSRTGAVQLAELSEEVSWIARKGRELIAQRLATQAQPANMAADIATLSQRLAKTYLLQAYGLKIAFLPRDLASARAEFDALSRQLKALPDNDTALKGQLALLDSQWFFFQQAIDELAKHNADLQLRRNVISSSERIYEVALELVGRYQRRGKV